PSSKRQSSSLRMPVRFGPLGLTWAAVDRRADDTFGATVVSTTSAASSRRGAAHSRAPKTASSSRGAAHSFAPRTPWRAPWTAVFPTGTACAATSFARSPSVAAPLVVPLVFIRDTVNLPSVIPAITGFPAEPGSIIARYRYGDD